MKSRLVSLPVLAFGLAAVSWGQIGTSTITGRITDPSGAVIPHVSVTVVQLSTNFTQNAISNEDGIYRVLSLQPGQYRVSFESQGFKKTVRENVELRTGDTLAVDMVMQVGSVSESVEVTGVTQLLETETSATGTVVSGNVLYDMPLYQRYVNSTLHLVPGMTQGGYGYGGSLGAYHLAGQRAGAIGIFEDGVNGNDQNGGTETPKPMQNSVAEVKVLTTVPPAEYGHSAGGVISAVKKSGTNELHGMGSFYGRTRMMQHRLFFDRLKTSQPAPGRPNGVPVFFMQPDANIGGPVMIPKLYDGRNKTFFFFGYQRLHEKKVAQVDTTVPTDAMKAGNFNFPGIANANQIFDPATTRFVNGAWLRDAFPGNIIPQSRIDPVARKVIEFDPWRAPNRPGTFNANGPNGNYLADEFARTFLDDYNLRLDHQFTPNFKIYYSWTDNRYSGFGRPWNLKDERPEFDAAAGNYSPSRNQNMSFGKTWIVSPTLVNDARVGYYRRWAATQVPSYQQNWAGKLGIPNLNGDLMPSFSATSTDRLSPNTMYGLYGSTPSQSVNETISFRNDLSYMRGTHAFKFGYELLRFRLNSAILANPVQFDFSNVTAGLQANGQPVPATGNTFAGFMTGYVAQTVFRSELTSWLPRSSIHSFYIQDDWKVTPTLTANIGLRYSNESPFTTKYGLMSQFDPAGADPLTGQKGAIAHPTSPLAKRDSNNFNPRVGLAWHPLQKWVFRGGFGMYTVDIKYPSGREMYDEYQGLVNVQPAPGDPTPIYQISKTAPLPSVRLINGVAPFVGTNYGGRSIRYWDPSLRNPYTMNWNASIQYELARDYLVDVSYQGSAGVGLLETWNINTFPVDYAANDPALRNRVFAAAQNFRPFPQFGDITMRSNFGHSTFHSGTVKFEKRMSKGLYFDAFYTFSKAINSSDSDNSGGGVAPIQNRNLEKGRAGYDRNHRMIGVLNWEIPFGKGKKWGAGLSGWKNTLMGGWELSWIQTLESGNPLNFTFANSPYNYYPGFAGARRPDLVGTPVYNFGLWNNGGPDRFTLQNRPAVIDQSAFAYPAAFTPGNAGRNILTGPRMVWAQVSAQKNFRISEKVNAQFRWDFQNALKTYNFTGPTTTVDFVNPRTFGKLQDDPRTASFGGQPLMNITVMLQF
ncbi:MAG: TonB-dependent receptor [Bryobacterales bacterium]|nr:TonB-dependent receptor [Bryobacterales bacterium]